MLSVEKESLVWGFVSVMAFSLSNTPPLPQSQSLTLTNPFSFRSSPPMILSLPQLSSLLHSERKAATASSSSHGHNLLKKPLLSQAKDTTGIFQEHRYVYEEDDAEEEEDEKWVDWEDQILEDTVPLVGFVRMILHSGQYESGDRLSPEHEKTILEKLLPFHPESEKKIGCGIDYVTIGYHPNFERSRCLFLVRQDGELVDFSYWKCIKGLIRKNYPLYADSFILRHFRKRSRKL